MDTDRLHRVKRLDQVIACLGDEVDFLSKGGRVAVGTFPAGFSIRRGAAAGLPTGFRTRI